MRRLWVAQDNARPHRENRRLGEKPEPTRSPQNGDMAVAENDRGARGEKVKPNTWPHGLKGWIEAAKKRLHQRGLAIALANKLARLAWNVPAVAS